VTVDDPVLRHSDRLGGDQPGKPGAQPEVGLVGVEQRRDRVFRRREENVEVIGIVRDVFRGERRRRGSRSAAPWSDDGDRLVTERADHLRITPRDDREHRDQDDAPRALGHHQRPDGDLGACGDGSDQAGRTGRAQGIAVPTFKPDPGEMRRV